MSRHAECLGKCCGDASHCRPPDSYFNLSPSKHHSHMPRLSYFVVDAFATQVFRGNPAGVCPLDTWLPDSLLQAIAAENNLSETAFFIPDGEGYRLCWLTPTQE